MLFYFYFLERNVFWYWTCKFNSDFLVQVKWNENGKKVKTKGKWHSVQWTRDLIK